MFLLKSGGFQPYTISLHPFAMFVTPLDIGSYDVLKVFGQVK